LDRIDLNVYSKESIGSVQADIEANLPVIEDLEIKDSLESAIFKLEECIYLMDDQTGRNCAKYICADLAKYIKQSAGDLD